MITTSQTLGAVKKFRRTPWRFQQTVERPDVAKLGKFVETIIGPDKRIEEGTVILDGIIFGTHHLARLFPASAQTGLARESSISAHGKDEMHALLVAAFMDGPDFIFIPTPKPFVFYADHDDWITFYANTQSNLNHVIEPLAAGGYTIVADWQREF